MCRTQNPTSFNSEKYLGHGRKVEFVTEVITGVQRFFIRKGGGVGKERVGVVKGRIMKQSFSILKHIYAPIWPNQICILTLYSSYPLILRRLSHHIKNDKNKQIKRWNLSIKISLKLLVNTEILTKCVK